jgi:heptaprenyl diphosphate synthase
MDIKKQARISLLLALSVVLSIIEGIVPIFNGFIPGLKIGLANIAVLFVLYKYSFKDAFILSVLRVFIVAILRTGLFSITFSFSLVGAILSIAIMAFAKNYTKLSIIGISTIGSISHTIGQLIVAAVFLNTGKIFYYFPILLIISTITGIFIGLISRQLYLRISKIEKTD